MCVTARLVCALCVYALASSAPLAFFLSTYMSVVDGYSIEASDGSLPQGIVRIGESFNITLSDSVYGTLSADFAQVYVGFQCAWPDALGIILPENTCTRRVAQSLLSCSFRLDPEREISSYLLSAPFLYLCFAPNSTTPVVSLGTIRMRIPFQNPRRFLPKVILANAVARLRVVSTQMLDGSPLAQPLPTDTDFQFTVIGSNAETFLGEVALSSDTCRTFIGTATVSQSSPQSIVVVVTGGLPRGQYMVCFRRTVNASWLGVSSLIGHPVNDIQIGTDYYGAATPSVVTFTVQPVVPNGNTQNSPLALGLTITNTTTTMAPYAQFGDLITVHMTFPPRAMPTALYIGLDYAFNACILPVFSAVQKLSLPSSNTSTTVSWSVSPTHDRSVLNLSNWSLSACFAYAPLPESLPNQVTWSTPSENAIAGGGSQLWNTMGPTSLIVYECDSSAASIPGGEGCVVCPAYNGDTCSRNAGHGVCGRPVPLLSMYQEAANCVCYAGYQGVACEVTVCTAPDVSPSQSELDMEDTYSHPLTITVVPQQAECTAYIRVYEVVPDASGSTVNVLVIPDTPLSTSSNAYTLSISGVLLVETWSGGPVQTNVNSAIVSRTLALDLVAFPPTIIRPVDGSLVADDLGALRVELSTAEQPVEGCQTLVQVRTTLTAAEQATGLYGSASDRIVVGPAQYDAMGDDDFSLDVLPHLSDATQELFVDAWSSCPGMRNSTIVTVRTQFDPQLEWMPSVPESGSYLRLTAPAWAQDVRFTSTLGAYAMNIATCTCSVEAECTSGGEGRYTMRALYPGDHTCTVALPGIGTATFPLRMVRPPVERSVFAPSDLDLIVLYSYMPDISEVGLSIVRPLPIGLNDSSSVQVWISTSDSYAQAYNLEDANRTTMVSYRSCIFARYVHAAFVDATETPLYEQICFHAAEGTPYVVTWRYRTVPLFHTATDLDQALNLLKVSSDAHTNDSSTRPAVKQTKRSNKHVQYESFLLSILIVSIAITFLLLTMTMFVVPQCGRYLVWEFMQWLFNKQSNEVHT